MAIDWRDFNRRFDPFRTLDRHEIAHLYAERGGTPPWRRLADEIVHAAEPGHVRTLLVGARGSGKTTELLRLHAAFSEDAGDWLPVYVDFSAALPHDAGTLAILAVVGAAVRAAADDWKAPRLEDDPLDRALAAFKLAADWLPLAVRVAGALARWVPPTGHPAVETVRQLPWWDLARLADAARVRLSERTHPASGRDSGREERGERLVAAVQAELDRLRHASGRTPVLLVDGLDKRPDMDSVRAGLTHADLLVGLQAPLVLSGPMQLRLDPYFAGLMAPGSFSPLTLHNLPVVRRTETDAEPCDEGIEVLLELYRRRVADEAARPLRKLFSEDGLRRLAHQSSGVVREFLTLLKLAGQASRLSGHERVEAADVEAALRERRHDLQTTLDTEGWEILARVYRTARMIGDRRANEMLLANLIVCYPNHDVWFRPHELLVPAVRRDLEREAAANAVGAREGDAAP